MRVHNILKACPAAKFEIIQETPINPTMSSILNTFVLLPVYLVQDITTGLILLKHVN